MLEDNKETMMNFVKLIHWMSSEHNPYEGINPGFNVFSRFIDVNPYPGVFCVPETMPFMWGPGKHRDMQVVLNVPLENVRLMVNGKFIENTIIKPNLFKIKAERICMNDDNSVVVDNFNPSWIEKVSIVHRVNDFEFDIKEINERFWK